MGENHTTGNGTGGELTSRTGAAKRCSWVTTERQKWVLGRERLVQPSKARRVGIGNVWRSLQDGVARNRESVDAPVEIH